MPGIEALGSLQLTVPPWEEGERPESNITCNRPDIKYPARCPGLLGAKGHVQDPEEKEPPASPILWDAGELQAAARLAGRGRLAAGGDTAQHTLLRTAQSSSPPTLQGFALKSPFGSLCLPASWEKAQLHGEAENLVPDQSAVMMQFLELV